MLGAPRARAVDGTTPPVETPAARGPASDPDSVRLGGFAGYGASTTSGLALRFDGEVPFRAGARLAVSWVGSLGFSRLARGETGFGVTRTVTVTVLDVVPAVRLSLALGDRVAAYADGGIGVYRAGTAVRQVYAFDLGTTKTSSSELGTMMRLGAGVWVRAMSRLDVGGGFDLEPHFGSQFGETTLVLHAGAMYRL
jgi:opacity protein-like surface antigen